MPHKFKIGTVVYYHPKDRMLSTARGTYTITRLVPAMEGHQLEYRIKHFSEEFERVAFENDLTTERRGTVVRELIYISLLAVAAAWPLLLTADCLLFCLPPLRLSRPTPPFAGRIKGIARAQCASKIKAR